MLGLMLYPDAWQAEPLFKVKNPELHRIMGYKGEMVSFNDLMDPKQGDSTSSRTW